MRGLLRILRCLNGATAIEYALVASIISIAAMGAMIGLGNSVDNMFHNVQNHL
jgi:pilus assembly protein Flp/PilA